MKTRVKCLFLPLFLLLAFSCDFGQNTILDPDSPVSDQGFAPDAAGSPDGAARNIVVPTNGLVGKWEFDTLTLKFTPGTPSMGVVSGAVKTYGWDSNSFYFDGGDAVTVPDNSALDFGTGNFSFFCLIKSTDINSVKTIIDKRDSSGVGYHITTYNGNLLLQIADGSTMSNFISNSTYKKILTNVWHNLIITVDRASTSGIKMYIDGVLSGTFDPTSIRGNLSNSANLLIGKHKDNGSSNFKGRIDKVLLYNRVLSSSEVIQLSAPGLPPYEPTVWNEYNTRMRNNCYNYSANVINNQYAQPGYASGIDLEMTFSVGKLSDQDMINALHWAVIADGLEPVGDDYWSMYLRKDVVALVFGRNVGGYGPDYHFYRLNSDLVHWTHKRGQGPVEIRDASGQLIYEPKYAAHGDYTYFVGYYTLWSDSQQGKGHEYIRGKL